MKKTFLSLLSLALLSSITFADCSCNQNLNTKENLQTTNECKTETCKIEDDEYCTYNQCYMNKHFKIMKQKLCLSAQQESNIDCLYKKYKSDLECLCNKYRIEKNKLMDLIECNDKSYKEKVSDLKELRSEMKERTKQFKFDVKEQLCKEQYKAYKKFNRQEKRRMKRFFKYAQIYKLPCKNCG